MNRKALEEMLKEAQELHHYYMEIAEHSQTQTHEVMGILGEMEQMRQSWQKAELENEGLKALLKSYEEDTSCAKGQSDRLQIQLADARATIAGLAAKNDAYEKINKDLREKLDTISKHVRDGFTTAMVTKITRVCQDYTEDGGGEINASNFSVYSEPDTMDDLDDDDRQPGGVNNDERATTKKRETSILRGGRTWYRGTPKSTMKRSRSKSQPNVADSEAIHDRPKKRSKESPDEIISKPHHVEFDVDRTPRPGFGLYPNAPTTSPAGTGEGNSLSRRSMSEPRLGPHTPSAAYSPYPLKSYISAGTLNQLSLRAHQWASKSVFGIGEHCNECPKHHRSARIRFADKAYKCTECGVQVCGVCRETPPLPCVPKASTPKRNLRGYLADFTPTTSPMIPHLVILCIKELERRGLGEVGLYRVPGKETDVVKLTEGLLWDKVMPNLQEYGDIHVISSCLKKFFTWLREPVIPHSSWHDFVRASDMVDGEGKLNALEAAVADMPQPNRETLAYLIVHLKKVGAESESNRMSEWNLASVFGPTIVGFSSEMPAAQQIQKETPKQSQVMMALFGFPVEYWENQINVDGVGPLLDVNRRNEPTTPVTPEYFTGSAHNGTMLGPLNRGDGANVTPSSSVINKRSSLVTGIGIFLKEKVLRQTNPNMVRHPVTNSDSVLA